MKIRVRHALPDDAFDIAALDVATWRIAYRGLMPDGYLEALSVEEKTESWRANLEKHQALALKRALVAESDGRIVGYARVGPVEDQGKKVGLLYLLYVSPEHWNKGVGKMLLDDAMEDLVDLGQHEAILWVLRDNTRGRRFYEARGWSADGRSSSEDYGGVTLEAVCYRRRLIS